jgi:ketosteroid isomerase-like protein
MIKIFSFLLVTAVLITSAAAQQRDKKIKAEIRAVLDAQVAAWNKGDVEGFMQGYWNSPNTTFSGRTFTRGWKTVLENYRKNYNTAEKMGVLEFGELEINPLSKTAAYVTGTWQIIDKNKNPHGRFTLVFRRFKNGWRIVHDHTS